MISCFLGKEYVLSAVDGVSVSRKSVKMSVSFAVSLSLLYCDDSGFALKYKIKKNLFLSKKKQYVVMWSRVSIFSMMSVFRCRCRGCGILTRIAPLVFLLALSSLLPILRLF